MAYLQIDWHDFVVVETIDFSDTVVAHAAEVNTAGGGGGAHTAAQEAGDEEMDLDDAPPSPKRAPVRHCQRHCPRHPFTCYHACLMCDAVALDGCVCSDPHGCSAGFAKRTSGRGFGH